MRSFGGRLQVFGVVCRHSVSASIDRECQHCRALILLRNESKTRKIRVHVTEGIVQLNYSKYNTKVFPPYTTSQENTILKGMRSGAHWVNIRCCIDLIALQYYSRTRLSGGVVVATTTLVLNRKTVCDFQELLGFGRFRVLTHPSI